MVETQQLSWTPGGKNENEDSAEVCSKHGKSRFLTKFGCLGKRLRIALYGCELHKQV